MPEALPEGYYLRNLETVLSEVLARSGELLHAQEREVLEVFQTLPEPSRRLYVRMLTRKGPWFREDGLTYAEIGSVPQALEPLLAKGLCSVEAPLGELLPLVTREELVRLLSGAGGKGLRREQLLERLHATAEPGALEDLLRREFRPVRPLHRELWSLVFLLFFGNFEQDLSSFVVADLGRVQYEPYAVDPWARPFQTREEVDFLVSVRGLREAVDAGPDPDLLGALTERTLAMEPRGEVRSQRRFQGLLNDLGHAWERQGDPARALGCYHRSERPPARERRVRLLARLERMEEAMELALALAERPRDLGEARFARTFLQRQRRTQPLAAGWLEAHPAPEASGERVWCLPRLTDRTVEQAALEAARTEGWEGFLAENVLWRALFGLWFWEELFAPLPGAFLHRFQGAPLDLGGPEFYLRRREILERRWAELGALEPPGPVLLDRARQKWGVVQAFLSWRHLREEDLAAAVHRIEPHVLKTVFKAMLPNPTAFDSGFPDLFLYRPESPAWKVWEVKGPGDRVRPEQAWWLGILQQAGVEAVVARVKYA